MNEIHDDKPLRVIMLPKPRRSRHPYQWSCLVALLVYSTSNLIVGPAAHSPLLSLQSQDSLWLNWPVIAAAGAALTSMIVRAEFWRLLIELCGHILLSTIMVLFTLVSTQSFAAQLADSNHGLSLNMIFASAITVAAVCRCLQLGKTIRGTWLKPNQQGILVEVERFQSRQP